VWNVCGTIPKDKKRNTYSEQNQPQCNFSTTNTTRIGPGTKSGYYVKGTALEDCGSAELDRRLQFLTHRIHVPSLL